MKSFLLLSFYLIVSSGYCDIFRISDDAPREFAGRDALQYTQKLLSQYPELQKRMLTPDYRSPGKEWEYGSQTYASPAVMEHLIALQIKAMAERHKIRSKKDIIHPKHGIGSKNHKDKGTINNPLSFFGHPVQEEILATNSRLKTLRVYHAFRKTIKNDLIRFARHQNLEWHQQSTAEKLSAILSFLEEQLPAKTKQLRDQLKDYDLELEQLIQTAIETNLLS